MPTLYEQLGGAEAVDAAVELFYRKVVSDPRISHFFDGIEMKRQIVKQKAFLTTVFGGPNKYTGRTMRAAHRDAVEHGLNDTHFDAVVELLGDSLGELGVKPQHIAQVAAIAWGLACDCVICGHCVSLQPSNLSKLHNCSA